MMLLTRISLLALLLVNTPSTAAPCNPCAGASGPAVAAAGVMAATPGPNAPHARLVRTAPARDARCVAAHMDDHDRLVELHRSIRDGGLGALRTPTSTFGAAPTVSTANPAGCHAG